VFANKAGTGRADVNASLAEGIAEVFSGAHDVGLSRLTASLEKALFLNVTTRETLTALAKCYERAGRHEDALIYLKRLVSFQRDIHHGNILRHVKSRLDQIHALPVEGVDPALEVLSATELVAETATQRAMRREVFLQSIQGLVRLAVSTELREDKSGERPYRVGKLAEMLAKAAGCDEETIFLIGHSARLHDIGKVSLPDGISLKTVALNRNERTVMQAHAEAGSTLLRNTKIKQIGMAADIARWHHERWDGQGYPDQLQGTKIPLEARITAIADCFDAMTHERPYRAAMSVEAALASIGENAGHQFDPELVPLFASEIRRMFDDGVDLDDVLGAEARTTSFSVAKERVWASQRRPDGADGAPA
jgi:putative two-component system response regulator